MIKFTVAKKEVVETMGLLVQIMNLKSRGEIPSESCCLEISPTTLTITANSSVNVATIQDIPIILGEGNVADHLDKGIMVNTKKFANIIKGCGKTVNIQITDTQIHIGEGKKKYILDFFLADAVITPEIRLFDYTIPVKQTLKDVSILNTVIKSAISLDLADLSGTLLSSTCAMASDRNSILYLKNPCILKEGATDLYIDTDLLEICLTKTSFDEVYIGMTTDNMQFVLKIDNMIVYKKVLILENFPKEPLLQQIELINQVNDAPNTITTTISLKEFMTQFKETHSIIEAEQYALTFNEDSIVISEDNGRNGVGGGASVSATSMNKLSTEMPDGFNKASFLLTHLLMLGKIFEGEDALTLTIIIDTIHGGETGITKVIIQTESKLFFFIPRVSI